MTLHILHYDPDDLELIFSIARVLIHMDDCEECRLQANTEATIKALDFIYSSLGTRTSQPVNSIHDAMVFCDIWLDAHIAISDADKMEEAFVAVPRDRAN